MDIFWLSRGPGQAAEGPFGIGHLRRLWDAGEVTAMAQICRQGEEEWFPLEDELEQVRALERQMQPRAVRELSFEEALRARDEELGRTFGRVINGVTVVICLLGLVPVLGLLAFAVWGLWALVASILCVLQMTKGQVNAGIWNLVAVWIFAPLIIAVLQAFSLGVMQAMAER